MPAEVYFFPDLKEYCAVAPAGLAAGFAVLVLCAMTRSLCDLNRDRRRTHGVIVSQAVDIEYPLNSQGKRRQRFVEIVGWNGIHSILKLPEIPDPVDHTMM